MQQIIENATILLTGKRKIVYLDAAGAEAGLAGTGPVAEAATAPSAGFTNLRKISWQLQD